MSHRKQDPLRRRGLRRRMDVALVEGRQMEAWKLMKREVYPSLGLGGKLRFRVSYAAVRLMQWIANVAKRWGRA